MVAPYSGAMFAMDDVPDEPEEPIDDQPEELIAEDAPAPVVDGALEEATTSSRPSPSRREEELEDDAMLGRSVPIDIPMMRKQLVQPPPTAEKPDETEGDFQPPHSLVNGDEFSAREPIVGRIKSDGTWTGEKGYTAADGT